MKHFSMSRECHKLLLIEILNIKRTIFDESAVIFYFRVSRSWFVEAKFTWMNARITKCGLIDSYSTRISKENVGAQAALLSLSKYVTRVSCLVH